MSFLKRLLNCFNAEGIREAMRDSYAKHRRLTSAGMLPLPAGTTPHQAGLYGALSTRYTVRGSPVPEVVLWGELAPFLVMTEDVARELLAEYVVYQERPNDANVTWLSETINGAFRAAAPNFDESPAAGAVMGLVNQVAWSSLLSADNSRMLSERAQRILSAMEQGYRQYLSGRQHDAS